MSCLKAAPLCVSNILQSNVRLRLRVAYSIAGQNYQDQVDFSGFPPSLTGTSSWAVLSCTCTIMVWPSKLMVGASPGPIPMYIVHQGWIVPPLIPQRSRLVWIWIYSSIAVHKNRLQGHQIAPFVSQIRRQFIRRMEPFYLLLSMSYNGSKPKLFQSRSSSWSADDDGHRETS